MKKINSVGLNVVNIIILIGGIFVYPAPVFSSSKSFKELEQLGVHHLIPLLAFLSWLTALILFLISITRIKNHKNELIFWIGMILNAIIAIRPILILILIVIAVVFFGANH